MSWRITKERFTCGFMRFAVMFPNVLAVVIALGWPLAPAAHAVDLVANRTGRAAPDARVTGIPMTEVHFDATDGVRLAHWLGSAISSARQRLTEFVCFIKVDVDADGIQFLTLS